MRTAKLRQIIEQPDYYESRLHQMAELYGVWTARNIIAESKADEGSHYLTARKLESDAIRTRYIRRMHWYLKKLGHEK